MREIVVGIDGSATSHEALRWAVLEAAQRGAKVIAVHAWTYPVVVGPLTPVVIPDLDFEAIGMKVLDHAVDAVVAGDVTVDKVLVEQGATEALLRMSRDADLLVIGSRGLGGFRSLLMGSVGHECVQHATCPVVVIPHADRQRLDVA